MQIVDGSASLVVSRICQGVEQPYKARGHTGPTLSASSEAVAVGSIWKRKLPSLDLIRTS